MELERNFSQHIQRIYSEISTLGLSAGLSRLKSLEKFQHSVNHHESLATLDFLLRLCDQFRCEDIPELFELFFIYEYWKRINCTIFLTTSVTPDFQINNNSVTCMHAEISTTGCLDCSSFDACAFPRVISPDDLSEANWRCIVCGNPLEFATILFQKWLSYTHHVRTHFLCCLCFAEYSLSEDNQENLPPFDLSLQSPELPRLQTHNDGNLPEFRTDLLNFKDLLAVLLGFLSILAAQFEDPTFPLYYKVPHPIPHDELAWHCMQIASSQLSFQAFAHLANILPKALSSPRLEPLFEYCFSFLEPTDIVSPDGIGQEKGAIFLLSHKFRDFFYVLIESPHISRINALLKDNAETWIRLNSWVVNHFT